MKEETQVKIAKVKELLEAGSKLDDALSEAKLSHGTWYSNKSKKSTTKKKKMLTLPIETLPFEAAQKTSNDLVTVALIKCSKETAAQLLRGF